MLKRIACLMMTLLLLVSCAAAETTVDDGLETLDDDALLDMMSQIPEDGKEDNSSFLVLPDDVEMPDSDTYTILLIGTDSYSDDKRGRSDTTVVVKLDAGKKNVRMVSFLRDMYVKIPGKSSGNRINASYYFGGAALLEKTLESNFDVTVDAYVAVNFERLVGVIDAIGGVEIEVSEKEMTQVNSILRFYNTHTGAAETDQLLETSGTLLLTGKQALCFSRIRKIDSDFARTNRQRKVLEAAFRKVAGMDIASSTALIVANMDAVTTDLTAADAIKLIPLAIRAKNATFESISIPAEGAYVNTTIDGMAVLRPDLAKNKKIIAEFLN